MQASDIRGKTVPELRKLLLDKLRERFNLRMQHGSGQPARPSHIREVRRDIARIQTVINETRTGKA